MYAISVFVAEKNAVITRSQMVLIHQPFKYNCHNRYKYINNQTECLLCIHTAPHVDFRCVIPFMCLFIASFFIFNISSCLISTFPSE